MFTPTPMGVSVAVFTQSLILFIFAFQDHGEYIKMPFLIVRGECTSPSALKLMHILSFLFIVELKPEFSIHWGGESQIRI